MGIIPEAHNLNESETQQLCESFGRSAPIALAERISVTLTENLLQTTEKSPWELTKVKPTLRIFTNEMEKFEEVTCTEDPDAFIARLIRLNVFDRTTKAVFITHGFVHDINTSWLTEMKNALLKVENVTAILLGWGGGSNIGIDRYNDATRNIETVGCWIGNYVRQMKRHESNFQIWGVGHSLGAHLFGFASKCSNKSFDRITGLDPAGPNFEIQHRFDATKLEASDAKIVDIIHTDGYAPPLSIQAISSPTNHYGSLIPMGTIDFYPNWGHSQPGCTLSVIGSHNRAFELFIKSISSGPGSFKTNMKVSNCPRYMSIIEEAEMTDEEVEMGYYCEGGSGNYYFDMTSKESQFGLFVFP